jgi:acyl-coenzyme A thioesterase PaaI-like protein
MAEVPEGFVPIFRTSPFLNAVGPIYSKGRGADLVIGLRVEDKHANARGFAHGGLLATVADIALGYTLASSTDPPTSMVTTNLTIDYAGNAKIGDWIEVRVDIQKLGTRLAFANAYLSVDSDRIARASAVFLVVGRKE